MRTLKFFIFNALLMASTATTFGQKTATLNIGDSSTQLSNETTATAIAVSRAILEGDWQKLDALLDSGFTYTGDGYVFSKDQYIGFMQDMRAAFSDFEMILEKVVTEGDFVSIRFSSKVVNTGKFMGAPANNKHLLVTGIFQRKVKDGKIIQEWQTTDLLGTMHQIGFGALFGYAVFVGGFKVKQEPPVRKPADFLHLNGKVENFDRLSGKEKNQYVKDYLKNHKGR